MSAPPSMDSSSSTSSQASSSRDMSQQFNSQCVDPSDLSAFIDFNQITSPAASSAKAHLLPSSTSSLTSPASALSHDMNDENMLMRPSHDYGRFKQQTGLPVQADFSVLNQPQMFGGYNTGIYDVDQSWDLNNQVMDPSIEALFGMTSDVIDPLAIMKQEEAQANIRYFPGMHQQVAMQKQAMMAKQKQREAEQRQAVQPQSQTPPQRRSVSSQPLDARTEETISRVMSEIRRSSNMAADSVSANSNNMLPQIIRSKRDEEEMDEDERLLNSEEGKKLSSKERRQLRNKVSARAFRSRRKEYITQLEGEISMKAQECMDAKHQNQLLMEENARFRALAEKLLSHAAFQPFLEDLSRDPDLVESFSKVTSTASMVPPQQSALPKEIEQFTSVQQYPPPQNSTHVGMTMIPEMPVDLSSLNIGPGNQWNNMQAIPQSMYQQPSVFTVEVPAEPVMAIDFSALSGKTEPAIPELEASTEKVEFAEIQSAPAQEEEAVSSIDDAFDENDPAFTLYATSPSKAAAPSEDAELLLSQSAFEKATQYFELVSCDANATMSLQFARLTAVLDTSSRRLENLMSNF